MLLSDWDDCFCIMSDKIQRVFLTLSWWRSLSYRNQSIDFLCKSMDWFWYDRGLRHESVKPKKSLQNFRKSPRICLEMGCFSASLYTWHAPKCVSNNFTEFSELNNHEQLFLLNESSSSDVTLYKICENTGFHWHVFSRIGSVKTRIFEYFVQWLYNGDWKKISTNKIRYV